MKKTQRRKFVVDETNAFVGVESEASAKCVFAPKDEDEEVRKP